MSPRATCVVATSRREGRASFYAPLVIARRAGCRRAFGCAHIADLGGDVLSRSAGWSAKRRFIYILADDAARCAGRHVGRHHDPPIPHDSAWCAAPRRSTAARAEPPGGESGGPRRPRPGGRSVTSTPSTREDRGGFRLLESPLRSLATGEDNDRIAEPSLR